MISDLITMIIITTLILRIIFNSLTMWLLSKLFKFEKQDYRYALIIAVIASFAGFLLVYLTPVRVIPVIPYLLYYIIDVVLIRYIYSQKWGKSFLVGLNWWVLGIIIEMMILINRILIKVFFLYSSNLGLL